MKGIFLPAGLLVICLMAITPARTQEPVKGLDPFHLYELRIQFADKHWENRLKAYKSTDRLDKISATIWFDNVKLDSVGIRFKGNSSFNTVRKEGSRKLPFSLDAGEFIEEGVFPVGYKHLKLSNGFRDPSYLRDILSYYIAREYMPAPECAMARVYINNEYFGVYTLTQDIDKQFLDTWFGEKKGAFFKCDPDWDEVVQLTQCPSGENCSLEDLGSDVQCYDGRYELKSDQGWNALINLTQQLNKPQVPLDSILDIDLTLWMLAFNNVLVNLDSYTGQLCHNFYLYQRKDNRFVPLIWDLNLSFGGFNRVEGRPLDDGQLMQMDPLIQSENPKRPLIHQLLKHPQYQKIYIAHMQTILDDFFYNGRYIKLMDQWHALIRSAVQAEQMPLYSFDQFEKNRKSSVKIGNHSTIGISELMSARVDYLKNHWIFSRGLPDLVKPDVQRTGADTIQFICPATNTDTMTLFWRKEKEQVYQQTGFSMTSASGPTGQSTFTCIITGVECKLEYYLVAENEDRARVWPAKGSFYPERVE
ncbi:MAG: CotH kinase family protein [Saprospiraceae bacterium]|nr:CotH kinase family protein [Saprospiraceae bacterium]